MRPYTKRAPFRIDPAKTASFLSKPVPVDTPVKHKTERKAVPVCNRMGKVLRYTEGKR